MLQVKKLDYSFDLNKRTFSRIEFRLEDANAKKEIKTEDEYKQLIEKAKQDFIEIEKFFDTNFPSKKFKKETSGTETPRYISAGFRYTGKKFFSPLECYFDCNFSIWNRTDSGFLNPYFSIRIHLHERSNKAFEIFQKMVNSLQLKFDKESEKIYNQMLKRLENVKSITPYSMFNISHE